MVCELYLNKAVILKKNTTMWEDLKLETMSPLSFWEKFLHKLT